MVGSKVADCIPKVKASRSSKLALEFLILSAARSAEVRKATWDEIDLDGATWTLPAERMKANREHRVPLSSRALEVLGEAAELSDSSGLIFPGARANVSIKGHPAFTICGPDPRTPCCRRAAWPAAATAA